MADSSQRSVQGTYNDILDTLALLPELLLFLLLDLCLSILVYFSCCENPIEPYSILASSQDDSLFGCIEKVERTQHKGHFPKFPICIKAFILTDFTFVRLRFTIHLNGP